jgi:hypothetical protein
MVRRARRFWGWLGWLTLKCMETGRASKTALGCGHSPRRAPVDGAAAVLDDPIAVRLVGPGFARTWSARCTRWAGLSRLHGGAQPVYARTVGGAVAQGSAVRGSRRGPGYLRLSQSVSRAAGLRGGLSATQEWKRAMLAEAQIALPASLTFVPLDFEHKTLAEGLAEAGFDAGRRRRSSAGWGGALSHARRLSRDAGDCANCPPGAP